MKKSLKCAAKESAQQFFILWQQAYDASPDQISILDKNHRIISINKAMAEAMQCSPQQVQGQHCFQLLHGLDHPPLACPHRALLEDGKAHHSEIYEERLNLWFLVTATPIYNEAGELMGGIHTARDITRRKHMEQALRESEERFRHLSEATMEGVLLSEESIIIAANQVLSDMVGYPLEALRGMSLFKLIIPQERSRLIQYLRNKHTGVFEFHCLRKDGTTFPIEAHTRAVTYKNGMVYQTAIRDLTEFKHMEQERAAHERMQGVLEMAGAVCHEINQPLMALHGFMDIIDAKAGKSGSLASHLEKMRDQIERIQMLTRKLTHITKYETKAYAGGERIIDIDQAASEEK